MRVSIPQGTIKSPTEKNGIVEMALFQFHKVRLKAEVDELVHGARNCFNSTRYD